MFAREEQRRKHPYRTALDLGCGSGNWSIRLAQRGWNVTGVDIVQKAIRDARARAKVADVQARFVQGSITALRAADIGSGFTLVLDFGAVHGLTPEEVRDTAEGVSEVTADDAVLLMYAASPGGWRGPLPRGLSRAEIEDAYAGWTVVDDYPFELGGPSIRLSESDTSLASTLPRETGRSRDFAPRGCTVRRTMRSRSQNGQRKRLPARSSKSAGSSRRRSNKDPSQARSRGSGSDETREITTTW